MNLKITSKIILLCVFLVFLTSLVLGGFSFYQSKQALISSLIKEKENEIKLLSSHINSRIEELRNDTLFLSSTPPIEGIIRSTDNNGIDPKDNSTVEQWNKRLSIIFKEMLYAKEDYVQIRLIGLSNGGKELIRVEKHNTKIVRSIEKDLQKKGSEKYFKDTLLLNKNQIYLSEFSANRELGKVVYPIEMVLRAAVPIYITRKEPFGIIIININYNKIFSSFKQITKDRAEYFVGDQNGNILLHSNPEFNIGHDVGTFKKVKDYMPELENVYSSKKDLMTSLVDRKRKKIVVSHKLRYNGVNPNDYLSVFLIVDQEKILERAQEKAIHNLWIMFCLFGLAIGFAFYFSRKITVPIKKLTDFAERIGQSEDIERIDIKSNDEIGTLAQKLNEMLQELDVKDLALKHQKDALDVSAIVVETDPDGKITYANEKFVEISKYTRDELIGKDHRIINSGHHSNEFFSELWTTIKSGNIWNGEIQNKAKDGDLYWVETTIYPVVDDKHNVLKYVAIRFDITEKKNTFKKLKEATVNAERAMETKSSFLANMSHEIRTPLNGISGFTDLLIDCNLPEEALDQVKHIKDCSDNLLMIINDILDISKIDAGKLNIEKVLVNLNDTVSSSLFVFNTIVLNKSVSLDYHIADDVPLGFYGDPLRIRQVLLNLIGNAVKFTEKGSVSVDVSVDKWLEDGNFSLIFKVKDTGIGIPSSSIDTLFNSFEQVDSTTTRKYGGTGLGLSISTNLVNLMGGKINVESKEGVGSTFSFTIKVQKVIEVLNDDSFVAVKKNENYNFVKDINILIAEDNKVNQILIKAVLSKLGYKNVDIVENGKKATEAILKKAYDIILMDIQMPEMDGYEATSYIRKNISTEIKIVGLSANVFKEDKDKAIECGMNDYLEKPIDIQKISEILKEVEIELKVKKSA